MVGIADGCFVSMVAPIAFELLGVKSATTGLGVLYCLLAGPMTAGPPLAGMSVWMCIIVSLSYFVFTK